MHCVLPQPPTRGGAVGLFGLLYSTKLAIAPVNVRKDLGGYDTGTFLDIGDHEIVMI